MTRDQLISLYAPLVRAAASRFARQLPGWEMEDLMQSGFVGLLYAVDRYDPRRRAEFPVYAKLRIRGAILDSLSGSRCLSSSEEAPEAKEPGANPERQAQMAELAEAVGELPEAQREILDLHYGQEMSLRAAGRECGISQAAAVGREARALRALRKRMAA